MRVILGLGNPGVEYTNTRHNAGVIFVDYLSTKLNSPYGWRREKNKMIFKSDKFILIKTADTFMNESGNLIANSPYQLADFCLAHDDLDIKLGEYKIQTGIGPKLHNGIESVERTLGDTNFERIRIGVDNRAQGTGDPARSASSTAGAGGRIQGEEYVLQKFSAEERETLERVFEEICSHLEIF